MPITVHHLQNSRSQRVLWLLEELGIPYAVRRYERDSKSMLAPAELRLVHPLGNHRLMPVLFAKLILGRVALLGRLALRKFQPMVDVQTDYIESELAARPWFTGESFTAADVMMSFPLEAARSRAGISRATHPHIFSWVDAIHARPAYQVALGRGGPYSYA